MKNRYIAIIGVLFVVLLFLVGCGQQQVASDDEDEPAPTPVRKTVSTREPEPEPEPVRASEPEEEDEPEPVRTMSKKVSELLNKHKGRVTSIRYMYQDQTIKPEEWETWVDGDKMHVKLREMDEIRGDVWIDNVYLDLRTQKAVGYCERNAYRCTDPNTPVDVNFNKYYRETPWEWIVKVNYAESEGTEQMQMRTMHKIVYEDDGADVTMWVDDYYGLPAMVRVVRNGVTNDYIYEDISFNTVDSKDLVHQAITTAYRD